MIVLMKKRILLSSIIISCFLTENVTVLAANNPSYTSSHLIDSVEPMWDMVLLIKCLAIQLII